MASKSDSSSEKKQIFQDLNADDDPEITEIESLCLQCHKDGVTKLFLTKIPFFKEVVLMSFFCEHCNWENNELQPASKIQEKGISYRLKVQNTKDLARVVVKTEWACIMIPELDFEIPPKSQEGTVTTVEGVVERAESGLTSNLDFLKDKDPESASKVEDFVYKLVGLRNGNEPFTFVLSDCTGNSFVENICVPAPDPQLEVNHFERSREENLMLGLYALDLDDKEDNAKDETEDSTDLRDEVLGLPTNCHSCNAPCVTNMKLTQIPHFKDVVIMSTICDTCGHKTNEVKSSSGIEPLGLKFTLSIESVQDLKRDILKSDTCSVSIKELELEVGSAAFGSRYTTVEGILTTIKEQLKEFNPLLIGDSADPLRKEKMNQLYQKLDEIILGTKKATLILDDPCGHSYLQSFDHPHPDTNLIVEKYERSEEQNEELGLLDMKVENYEES